MAEYSHVNLSELDDQAPNLGADPKDFNIFFGRVPLGCEDCGVSLVRYAPGVKAHGHRHKRQEEIYVLVSGSAEMKVGDDVIELKQWMPILPVAKRFVPPRSMAGLPPWMRSRAAVGLGRRRGDVEPASYILGITAVLASKMPMPASAANIVVSLVKLPSSDLSTSKVTLFFLPYSVQMGSN